MPKSFRTHVLSVLTTCALVAVAAQAQAQSIIKRPGAHPHYSFEAEPHLVLRDNTGDDGSGIGPGFRGTIVVVDQGFIGKINNSVGIGFGLDWLALGDEHCHGNTGNGDPNDDHCHDPSEIVLPVVMQWNFFLENGLLKFDPATKTMRINYDKYHEVAGKMLAKVLAVQYEGDKAASDRFIDEYTKWDENLHGAIAKKIRDGQKYRFRLFKYAALGE